MRKYRDTFILIILENFPPNLSLVSQLLLGYRTH